MPRRARHRDAPVERRARDRQILEPHFDEAHDLVLALDRQDEVGVCRVVREQLLLIGREAEEVSLLLVPFDGRAGQGCDAGAVANLRLALLVVGLVAHRVPAAVHALEDVAGLLHAPPQLGARLVVSLLGRADEIIVREAEHLRHLDEARRIAIGERARRDPVPIGRLLHLEAVLVGPGQKEDVLAVEPLEARDHVGRDGFIGVADVRHAVRVGNSRRNVEFFRHSGSFPRQP